MKSFTFLRCVAAASLFCAGAPALAQLNLPNALIKPETKKAALPNPNLDPNARNAVTGAPIEPPRPGTFVNATESARSDTIAADATLANARAAFAGYQVSAIVGSTAILRRQSAVPMASGASAALSNGQVPLPNATAATAAAAGPTRNQSLTIRHGEQFEFVSGTGTYTGKISNGRVIVLFDPSSGAKKGLMDKVAVVYAGELDVVTLPAPTIVLQTKDADLKASLKIQAGSLTGSAAGAAAPTSPVMPPPISPVTP